MQTIIVSSFFFLSELCFLILAVFTQIFNPTAELVIPIEIPTKDTKQKWKGIH